MKTVSYSLDEETASGIAELATELKLSKSDVVRSMYVRMRLEKTLEDAQASTQDKLDALQLVSEEAIANYAKDK